MNADELFALPTDAAHIDRWLFEGEVVERRNRAGFHSPAHAATVANLSAILARWCRESNESRAFGYGCPYRLTRNPDSIVSFDASTVRASMASAQQRSAGVIEGAPMVAVEVVELDEDADLLRRLVDTSLRSGVRALWIVDPFEESVVVHRPGQKPLFANVRTELPGGDALPGFRCSVAEIFE